MEVETPCYVKNRYIFTKFIIKLVALAVKSSLAGGDRDVRVFLMIFLLLQQHYKQN